jgi:hypothetical protein
VIVNACCAADPRGVAYIHDLSGRHRPGKETSGDAARSARNTRRR